MLMPLSAASEMIHAKPYDICLFDLPANAIKSVILGHRIRIENAQTIIQAIKSSPMLEHVAVKAAVMHAVDPQPPQESKGPGSTSSRRSDRP
jgi:hypothetical protein